MTQADAQASDFTVVICTRNRPAQLARTLEALERQEQREFELIVIDQSDAGSGVRQPAGLRWRLIEDEGRGLSRARNIGWRAARSRWVVFLDDDCLTRPDWSRHLRTVLAQHPDVSVVTGHVESNEAADDDYLTVSAFPVREERVVAGRWTQPWVIGLGVCTAIRRDALERLGGFDERLGSGAKDFPAAEDMDFNYRLLRAGESAFLTPAVRSLHDQWRTPAELGPLYRAYMAGWCGFAVKHLRSGDRLGGAWLWGLGALDLARMAASAVRRRSRRRLVVSAWKARGLAEGTVRALRIRW